MVQFVYIILLHNNSLNNMRCIMKKDKEVIINFHEPDITLEENEKRFEEVKKVVEKIAIDMIKHGVTTIEE